MTECNEEPSDELGTNDTEPESLNDDDNALDTDDAKLFIGQWMTMPRRSRRVARQDVIEPFVDVEPLENHGTGDEVTVVTMLHLETGNADVNYSKFKATNQGNNMLNEAVHILKNENEPRNLESCVTGFLLISSKAGIRKYRDKAVEALLKEFVQLNDKDTFEVTNPNNLTKLQNKKALKALSIITEKRDESVKGRTCADGRKQRKWKSKAESAPPTAHADSAFPTSVAHAHEGRFVGIADIKGVHLNAEFDEFLLIKFENEQVHMMMNEGVIVKVKVRYNDAARIYFTNPMGSQSRM